MLWVGRGTTTRDVWPRHWLVQPEWRAVGVDVITHCPHATEAQEP
jgi:hypothetical protein